MRFARPLSALGLVATLAVVAPTALAATPVPARVYSPYFETWTSDRMLVPWKQGCIRAPVDSAGTVKCGRYQLMARYAIDRQS